MREERSGHKDAQSPFPPLKAYFVSKKPKLQIFMLFRVLIPVSAVVSLLMLHHQVSKRPADAASC